MTAEIEMEMLRRLAQLVTDNGLSELTVEDGGLTVTVKAVMETRPPGVALTAVQAPLQQLSIAQTPPYSETPVLTPAASPAKVVQASTAVALESPMVGVFYRSPSPEDPPFVTIGDHVHIGQTIGLIEAMKVYSEVPSEVAGRVTATPVESGKLVQQGQPLIFVEPQ